MIFFIIPIMFLAINPMLNETGTIFRATLLAVITAMSCLFSPPKLANYKLFIIPTTLIISWYLLGWAFHDQSYADFLLGSYARGFGLLTLIGLYLLLFISADNIIENIKWFFYALYFTLSLALIYGTFQSFGLDFFKYKLNFEGIKLTLTNPNFSSAFLGILSVVPFGMLLSKQSKHKILNLVIFIVTEILIFQTASTQGFVLSMIGCLSLIVFRFLPIKYYSSKNLARIIVLSFISFISLVIVFATVRNLKVFNNLTKYLNENLGITDRLQHWLTGVRVWQDNPIFGVGVDNMGKFSGQYLSDNFLLGGFVNPDKSHNAVIDHFANGGIVVGVSWIYFIALVSWVAFRLQESSTPGIDDHKKQILVAIWLTYVLQTFISTDHLVIAVLGLISAGGILRMNFERTRLA
jgi:O-antigen ligase